MRGVNGSKNYSQLTIWVVALAIDIILPSPKRPIIHVCLIYGSLLLFFIYFVAVAIVADEIVWIVLSSNATSLPLGHA